ncbi:E4, partial [Odocoileus virginianus papillomavirus 1]|uniref:Probable protein E4 n=1 Tax=Odocoileus virginianus papillomavirus 1 TaxID=2772504 RepID=VE4_OVPVD
GITIVLITHILRPPTLERPSKDCGTPGAVKEADPPTRPTAPCFTLLLEATPFTVPSELAKTGVGPLTARLPTAHHSPRGVAWAPIPPPRCRARYRRTPGAYLYPTVLDEGRRITRRRQINTT